MATTIETDLVHESVPEFVKSTKSDMDSKNIFTPELIKDLILTLKKRIADTKFGKFGGSEFVEKRLNSKFFTPFGTSATTACGKTTCIAQLCAINALQNNKKKISAVITIPQRNSARNMCQYLNRELSIELFGYQIYGESYVPSTCLVMFCTTGWAVMKLLYDPIFVFDVFVLDEAHETNVDTSLCLYALAQLLKLEFRTNFKLIISSATIDVNEYKQIWKDIEWWSENKKDIESIHKIVFTDAKLTYDINSKAYNQFVAQQVVDLLEKAPIKDRHIIVHLDGQDRIEHVLDILKQTVDKDNVLLCPLYGQLPKEEQLIAIQESKTRKVILATNIVESSITINGLLYGICMPYHKIPTITDDGYNSLELVDCSKSNIIQRHGRIGRGITDPGFTKVLMTKKEYDDLKITQPCDILRSPMYHSILKFYGSYLYQKHNISIYSFFQHIPTVRIEKDTEYLLDYDLLKLNNGIYEITEIGKNVIKLSTSIPNGYMLYHTIYQIPKIYWFTMCVLLALKDIKVSPFYIPREKKIDTQYVDSFKKWYRNDDIETYMNLLNIYQDQWFQKTEKTWCKENNMYHQFFVDTWNGADRLFKSMYELSEELSSYDVKHSLTHTQSQSHSLDTLFPFPEVKDMMCKMFIRYMKDKVFVFRNGRYCTKKDYDKYILKIQTLFDQYDLYKNEMSDNISELEPQLESQLESETKSKSTFDFTKQKLEKGLCLKTNESGQNIKSLHDSVMSIDKPTSKFVISKGAKCIIKKDELQMIVSLNIWMTKSLGLLSLFTDVSDKVMKEHDCDIDRDKEHNFMLMQEQLFELLTDDSIHQDYD